MPLLDHAHDPEPFLIVLPNGAHSWSRYANRTVPGHTTVFRPRSKFCQTDGCY